MGVFLRRRRRRRRLRLLQGVVMLHMAAAVATGPDATAAMSHTVDVVGDELCFMSLQSACSEGPPNSFTTLPWQQNADLVHRLAVQVFRSQFGQQDASLKHRLAVQVCWR